MKKAESNMEKAGGPYYGPKGGKYSDPQHKIPWKEPAGLVHPTMTPGVKKEAAAYTAQLKNDMKAALSKVTRALGIAQAGAAVDKFLMNASEQLIGSLLSTYKSDAAGFQRMATETLRKALLLGEPILEKALMADMDALEKAAFPPKKGKKDEAPPNNVPPHPDEDENGMEAGGDDQANGMGQVIGQTEDGKKVYAAAGRRRSLRCLHRHVRARYSLQSPALPQVTTG